jgi:NitT/TauT family transport system ATP-binding protein
LFGWRTCIKNVELPAEIMHRRGVDALAALRLVGLEGVKDNYPSELSGGMKQRVALARALSYEAQILILDEPFAALDEITRAELNRQLLRLWTMLRFTCIFTTHSVTEAVSLADRVLILSTNKGGIEADIKVDLPRPRTDEVCETPNFLHLVRTIKEGLNL